MAKPFSEMTVEELETQLWLIANYLDRIDNAVFVQNRRALLAQAERDYREVESLLIKEGG